MKLKNIAVVPLLFLLVVRGAYAAFEDTGLGARLRGLGNSATALDDPAGAPLNPALPGSSRKFESGLHFESGTRSALGPLEFYDYAFGAAVPVMAYGKFGTMSALGRYRNVEEGGFREKLLSLGWATWQLKSADRGAVDIGTNLKFMRLDSARTDDSKMAIGVDVGALWRVDSRRSVGLSFLNMNSPAFKAGALNDKAPASVRLGAAERTDDYALTLDLAKRSGAGGYNGNFSLDCGFEHVWRTYRYGTFMSRTGLSLAGRASMLALGAGHRRMAAEVSYSILFPLTGNIVPGHAVSLAVRFGDRDSESEYEKLIRREIKYRKDLMEALDESSRREEILRGELAALRSEIDDLRSGLKAAAEQKAQVSRARERLEAVVARQRRAEAELAQLEEKRRRDRLEQLKFDFSRDWQAYLRMRGGGAPADALKGALQRLIGQYQGAGIDISQATVELQRLVQQPPR